MDQRVPTAGDVALRAGARSAAVCRIVPRDRARDRLRLIPDGGPAPGHRPVAPGSALHEAMPPPTLETSGREPCP